MAAGFRTRNIQTLVALLGSLMPIALKGNLIFLKT